MFFQTPMQTRIQNYIHTSSPIGDALDYQEMSWLYYMREWGNLASSPLNRASKMGRRYTDRLLSLPLSPSEGHRTSATLEMIERQTNRYQKPSFGITQVISSRKKVYQIEEKIVADNPFCQLIHFKKTLADNPDLKVEKFPKILVVAPYSGHFATLLRDTCRSLLKDHDVYVTDWANGRDVPIYHGLFKLDDYIQYLMDFIHLLGDNLHILAVCQPAVPVLATVGLMAKHNDAHQPKSMTLMGGPIDTRINPTAVNRAALEKPLSWFAQNVIARVPVPYPGVMRRVCPEFLMLSGFMSLNVDRHLKASVELYKHLVQGIRKAPKRIAGFMMNIASVLDLPADYFLDSVCVAFQEHCLPRGEMMWKGERVDLSAIRKTAILAVEGEKDDISGVGQTRSALDLCQNVPEDMKHYHLQKGVGHYGVFNGRRFRENIVPVIYKFNPSARAP